MPTFVYVSDDAVDITFTGLDKWITLTPRGHRLALGDVVSAHVAPRREAAADLGWRLGGGYWPGGLATGWFTVKGRKGVRQLWCVYRDPEVLVIETRID